MIRTYTATFDTGNDICIVKIKARNLIAEKRLAQALKTQDFPDQRVKTKVSWRE